MGEHGNTVMYHRNQAALKNISYFTPVSARGCCCMHMHMVGFVNLIPFPAFDGGRILFLIIEKIKGKPVKAETENLIHTIGFFILLALIIYVTINDIIRLV